MIHHLSYFTKNHKTHWQWPLILSTLDDNETLHAEMLQGFWAQKFINILPSSEKSANIVFLNDGFTKLNKLPVAQLFQADVVVIRADETYFTSNRDYKADEIIFKSITDSFGSAGIFIIGFHVDLSYWVNEFIIQLSHNMHICEALAQTVDHGVFYYDSSLEKETTLSYQVDTIKEDLYSLSKDRREKIQVQTKLTNQTDISLQDMLFFLEDYTSSFQYQHESGEAEGIAQLNQSLQQEFAKVGLQRYSQETKIAATANPSRGEPSEKDVVKPPPSLTIDIDFSPLIPSAGAEPTAPLDETEKNENHTPRYLQTIIIEPLSTTDSKDEIELDTNKSTNYLNASSAYFLLIRIGAYDDHWFQGAHAIPEDKIFTSPEKMNETLDIHFTSSTSNKQTVAKIQLKRTGKSTTAYFNFISPAVNSQWEGHIFIYHKNRLIQKATLVAHVINPLKPADKIPAAQLNIDFSFTKDFNALDQRSNFGTSIYYNAESIDKPIQGISNNKPLDLYFSTALQQLVKKIKDRIQEAVVNIDDHPEDLFNSENVNLLIRLALDGNNLYVNHLKKDDSFEGAIQIISNKSEFIPLDFVYTYAAPDGKSTLCPHAIEALNKGSCSGCDGIQMAPAKYVCPLGFWGFSHVIERHTSERYINKNTGDYTIIEEPNSERSTLHILQKTLYAVSNKVNANELALNKSLDKAMSKYTKEPDEAITWTEWTKCIEQKHPDSLVLIVHIEKDEITDQDQLEIGDGEFLIQNLLDQGKLKRNMNDTPPFVIIFGCEAAKIENYGFDVSSQLMNHGAAIVISNFTKIRGRHAVPIVMKLLEFLKQESGEIISLGKIILKLRQYFLAKGIIVSLALITHGDADWKIKT